MPDKQATRTPGPWYVVNDGSQVDEQGNGPIECYITTDPDDICDYIAVMGYGCNRFRDARLIAEAPAMLEALRVFLEEFEGLEVGGGLDHVTQAREIIQRIEGKW